MWRKFGDLGYSILVLAIFVVEALVMAALITAFALKLEGRLLFRVLALVMEAAVGVSAAGLITISAYVLGYHFISATHHRRRQQLLRSWTERWAELLMGGRQPPRALGGREAWEALLNVREAVSGPEADLIVAELRYRGTGRMLGRLRSTRKYQRLEALEELARARLPETFELTLAASADTTMLVRVMALRAAARILAVMSGGADRHAAVAALSAALQSPDLPTGLVEEVLLLLEDAAPVVLRTLLSAEPGQSTTLKAAIGAVARLDLAGMEPDLARHLRHPDPEVRAALLRTVATQEVLADSFKTLVVDACADPVEFLRIQAIRAIRLDTRSERGEILWSALGDASWWVRLAACDSLASYPEGVTVLRRAGDAHPDSYARQMAIQVLLDRGLVDVAKAVELREAI